MALRLIVLGALASLVAGIPQHAEHLHSAQIARSNRVFGRGELLVDRQVSQDGTCGATSGQTCGGSNCCSSLGWCGNTPLHCGTGCQAGFGQCGSSGEQSPASLAPAALQTTTTPATQPTTATTTTIPAPLTTVEIPVQKGGNGQQAGGVHTIPGTSSSATFAQSTPTTTPSTGSSSSSTSTGLGDTYKMYTGDGSLSAGWPDQTSWTDFDTAFENNRDIMAQSCAQFGAANNNNDEVDNLKSALQAVGASTGIDSRYLLAIMMQESGGCVRAPTTNYGVRNPGLFQDHDGSGTCNDGGNVQNPCPMSQITQMVTDGAAGTAAGDGLKQTLAEAGTSDVSKYYRAARIYNSGSIAASGLLQDGIATHCYASDVANRLTGWTHAAHGCTLS